MLKSFISIFISIVVLMLLSLPAFAGENIVKTITSEWKNHDVAIELWAIPDKYSGLQKVEYRIDSSEWMSIQPLEKTNLATSATLQLKSTDKAGNVSYSDKYYYRINKMAPTAPQINNVDSNAFYNSERTITITDGKDISGTGCGIQRTEYHINTGDAAFDAQAYWILYTQPITVRGNTTIEARSFDILWRVGGISVPDKVARNMRGENQDKRPK